MAFPNDALETTFAPLSVVPSATLNAIQNAILGVAPGATATVRANGTTSRWGNIRGDWICDGAADEVQINAAIAWVNGQGGGTVLLSEGTFTVEAAVVMFPKVRLIGAGREATILRVPNVIASSYSIVSIDADHYASVQALTVDGNRGAIGAFEHDGIYITGASNLVKLLDVGVRDCKNTTTHGNGIYINSATHAALIGCVVEDCDLDGIHAQSGATPLLVVACTVDGCVYCTFDGVSQSILGLQVSGGSVILNGSLSHMIGGHVLSSPSYDGIMINGASSCLVEGVTIGGGQYRGISIYGTSTDIQVRNNTVHTCGQQADNTHDAIYAGACTNATITGNVIRHGGGAAQHRYGIFIDTGANAPTRCLVWGNDLAGVGGRSGDTSDTGPNAWTWPQYLWNGAAWFSNTIAMGQH